MPLFRRIWEALTGPPKQSMTEEIDSLRQNLEKKMLESQLSFFGDNLVSPYEPLYDEPGFYSPAGTNEVVPFNYDNQGRGEQPPVYLTEYGLKIIRDQSRRLAGTSEFAINALTNRKSYIVGKGFAYEVVDKGGKLKDSGKSELAKKAQGVIDDFAARCVWSEREQETVWRCDRDGETFHRLFHVGRGKCEIRFIEPEWVRDYAATFSHRFGIISSPDDVEDVKAYNVVEHPQYTWDTTEVDASEIVHIKLNTDFTAKRGLPTLYAVRKNLERADKLLRNMSTLAQIQATFALIRKHKQYSASAINAFQQQNADVSLQSPYTANTQYLKQYSPGTILDTSDNTTYEFPTAGVNASQLVAILQAELRAVAARLCMPEYMLTVDASNANFASTLVAEAPAVKNFEALQAFYARRFGDGGYSHGAHCGIMWRVLWHAVEYGDLPREALTDLEIQAEGPVIVSRDRNQETQRNQTLNQAGVMSKPTWATREGLDYEQEQRQGAGKERQGQGGPPAPGDQPPGPETPAPAPPGSADGGDDGGFSDLFDFGEEEGRDEKGQFAASGSAHRKSAAAAKISDIRKDWAGPDEEHGSYTKPAGEALSHAKNAVKHAKNGDHATAREYHKDAAAAHEDAAEGHRGYAGGDIRHEEAAKEHLKAAKAHRAAADSMAGKHAEEDFDFFLEAGQHQPGDRWQGPSGRWFTMNKDHHVVPAKATQDEHNAIVDAAHEKVKGHLQKGHLSADHAHQLAGHLLKLNREQLTDLKKRLGLKASGSKYEYASKIASRALAGVRNNDPAKAAAEKGRPPAKPQAGQVYNVKIEHLVMDPDRFQYKLNVDKSGVTDELKQVKTWNPDFAGVVSVWKDPEDGKTYVVNGHHRRDLAGRLGVESLAVRYVQAGSAKEARAVGALVNIAEGRGTAVDAAKFMRDSGASAGDLAARGVSLKGKVAADASALSGLSDKAFDRLARGQMDENRGLAVARNLTDHDKQDVLFRLLDKREEEGKDLSNKVVEEMAKEMADTPTTKKTEATLWGDIESDESLFVQRNELKAHIRNELAREMGDFQAVASKRRAERVAGHGNTLDVEKNKVAAATAGEAKFTFDALVNRKGVISDAINDAAADYSKAKTRSQRDAIKEKAVDAVRRAIKTESEGTRSGGKGSPEPSPTERGAGGQAAPENPGRGDSGTAGLTHPPHVQAKVDAAMDRYASRDETARGGGLFGGEDLDARRGFSRLPDGAEVVFTEGPLAGKKGQIVHDKDAAGGKRIVARVDGETANVPITPSAIEPIDPNLSWRTETGGSTGGTSGGLFGAEQPIRREVHPDVKELRGVQGQLGQVATSGKSGTVHGIDVEMTRPGEFKATIDGRLHHGDSAYIAQRIIDAKRKRDA